MSQTLTKAITRPGAGPALLAAGGVFAALLTLDFLHGLLRTASLLTQTSGDYLGEVWLAQLVGSVTGPLPFAIGIFLSLWQIAPIAPQLRLAHVVTRSLLATVLAVIVLWLVAFVPELVGELLTQSVYADPGAVLSQLGGDAVTAVIVSLSTAVTDLPVALLGGILLWGWLQRHPSSTPARGALDEV
jgi:hypothetical protein